jgi:hypothetical protein
MGFPTGTPENLLQAGHKLASGIVVVVVCESATLVPSIIDQFVSMSDEQIVR